jgi:putative transposase
MSSYRQILYHLTFHTKNREKVLLNSGNDELNTYIWGVLKNKRCKLYRINGVEDHIHIVCDLHPSVALADLVKDIKVASSKWIKGKGIYPKFSNWAESYGAFTLSIREKDIIIKYVMNQQEHHKKESFREEFIRLLMENGVDFNERYLIQ